jgi:WD40 repeat protein
MSKHKSLLFAIVSIIFLVISSCSNVVTSTNNNLESTEAIQISTNTFTSTPTDTPTPTPVSLPLRNFTKRCLNVEHATTKGFLSAGTIFLRNVDSDEILLLTSGDEEPHLLTGVPEGSPDGVSQNWAWMFYRDSVITSNGKLVTTPHNNDQWGMLQGWLDSERIIFRGPTFKSNVLYIYNPFTQQEQIFAPKVTDRYQYDRELSGWPVWKFVPDPTLTRMAYVRAGQHLPELVLMDLENNKTLWTLRFSPGERHMPTWSPDGSHLAVISDDYQDASETYRWEVYTVNRDGQSHQWLDIYVKSGLLGDVTWGDRAAWSPNGRYIAFYGESLHILDTELRQIVDYCIPYVAQTGNLTNFRTPIMWSPDSRQVIFQPSNYQAVVINIENNRAIQLVDDIALEPLGWILSP